MSPASARSSRPSDTCGLCGDERSSADKAMRMPLSKQRNKLIQRTLVEAAKLAPRQSHELAVIYDKENRKEMGIERHSP
jgi:transposase